MKTFEEFIKTIVPDADLKYEMYKIIQTNPQDLVGRKVVATTNGFSCGNNGGTKMTIGEINGDLVKLIANEDTDLSKTLYGDARASWGASLDELPFQVKFY